MILEAAKAKITAYSLPIIGTLVVVASLAFWWLWSDRESLLEKNASLTQAMDQAKVTNEQNQNQIAQLESDIRWRDQQALIRSEREQNLSDQLAATESELKELVKDAPCSGPEHL
jgi:ABC-type xylose transport system substrate-binding protein